VVGPGEEEPVGHHPRSHRDAVRGRRRGRRARRAADRGADDDVHRVAGPAADDPEHVQDRGRTAAADLARQRARARGAGAVDLRGPPGCDGLPTVSYPNICIRSKPSFVMKFVPGLV